VRGAVPALALAGVVALVGCTARRPPTTVALPPAATGEVSAAAMAVEPLGEVRPIAVALTNGHTDLRQLDARQVFAQPADGARVAPLAPSEAARRAGGRTVPGDVRRGATGAVKGGVISALGGLISGAIQGGIGAASAVGAAVGAAVGGVTGALGGGSGPDVAGFEDRALPSMTLAPGFSATGWVYYPPGDYQTLDILLLDEHGEVETVVVRVGEAER
jgi:hypothetical protein